MKTKQLNSQVIQTKSITIQLPNIDPLQRIIGSGRPFLSDLMNYLLQHGDGRYYHSKYDSRALLCARLEINKNTYVKGMQELVKLGHLVLLKNSGSKNYPYYEFSEAMYQYSLYMNHRIVGLKMVLEFEK